MSPETRSTLLVNAQRIGGEAGSALVALIHSLTLPLGSGGMAADHPLYREMMDVAWSAEGKAAAVAAVKAGLPAMAGVDPLLQQAMGERYGVTYQGTMNAGYIVGEVMRHLGYDKAGEAPCPANCVAKTAATWKPRARL